MGDSTGVNPTVTELKAKLEVAIQVAGEHLDQGLKFHRRIVELESELGKRREESRSLQEALSKATELNTELTKQVLDMETFMSRLVSTMRHYQLRCPYCNCQLGVRDEKHTVECVWPDLIRRYILRDPLIKSTTAGRVPYPIMMTRETEDDNG